MDIAHHSSPINRETIESAHRVFIQNFQKSPKIKNEIIIVVINKNIQRFELIYYKKLIVVKCLLQTSYWNNVNSIFRTAIGILSNFCLQV